MVKRYTSGRRAKPLKDMPFYVRYARQCWIVSFVAPLAWAFIPPIYQMIFPSAESQLAVVDPRKPKLGEKDRVVAENKEKRDKWLSDLRMASAAAKNTRSE